MSPAQAPTAKYGDHVPVEPVGARIRWVDEGSPADARGLKPGDVILALDGEPVTDILDWLWRTDGDELELKLEDRTVTLTRDFGLWEPWGIDFCDPLFDRMKLCRNNCMFCFMAMLPEGLRPSLYLRDDDYRLSFLQGNFVTLTNMGSRDVARVIEQRLSPLHVSLHCVDAETRLRLMGKNHARGLEVLEELMAAGIDFHVQIVVVPGINDESDLDDTLLWIEQHPAILSVGIVPYGYTKYAELQQSSTSEQAESILARVAPYQERARETTGEVRFQPADEWFLRAGRPIPEAEFYGDYPQYQDGIGMLRAFIDGWREPAPVYSAPLYLVTGEAFAPLLTDLTEATALNVLTVKNNFFGGNVDVAGLLTASDIVEQLTAAGLPEDAVVLLPDVMFNDDGVTLDDKTPGDIVDSLKRQVVMVPCSAEGLLSVLDHLYGQSFD